MFDGEFLSVNPLDKKESSDFHTKKLIFTSKFFEILTIKNFVVRVALNTLLCCGFHSVLV